MLTIKVDVYPDGDEGNKVINIVQKTCNVLTSHDVPLKACRLCPSFSQEGKRDEPVDVLSVTQLCTAAKLVLRLYDSSVSQCCSLYDVLCS